LRLVTRAHLLGWRKQIERRELAQIHDPWQVAALSSLFEYLSDTNAVIHNPVKGVRRRRVKAVSP
jgi:hypothetical protein